MDIQAQWSLNSTSSSVFTVARGILQAATKDNVQPLAILACERFGSTIAMSPETCHKIEKSVVPTPAPSPIQFLRGAVGYSASDSATQLGGSLAGVQFLGLAAALVTTFGAFNGGLALEAMLRESAADKTLLPTVRQLKDLLISLEPRCHSGGFADSVVGWHLLLGQCSGSERTMRGYTDLSFKTPSPDCVVRIVDVFRQVARIGDARIAKVTMRSATGVAWLAAFTKWCLGMPPSLYRQDGTVVVEQESTLVDIFTVENVDNMSNLEIEVHHTLGEIVRLVLHNDSATCAGMVGVAKYGGWLLQQFASYSPMANRAVDQALPCVVAEALAKLKLDFTFDGHDDNDRFIHDLRLSPFPNKTVVGGVVALMLGSEKAASLRILDEGLRITDLPLVAQVLKILREDCLCPECSSTPRGREYSSCRRETFLENLASMAAAVLATSLFHFPETLRLRLGNTRLKDQSFQDAVYDVITTGQFSTCSVAAILELALELVGHDAHDQIVKRTWIISSSKGQVVYPTIFETCQLDKTGYLSLSWLPGILQYSDQGYSMAVAHPYTMVGSDPVSSSPSGDVSVPCNLVEDLTVAWKVVAGDDQLSAYIAVMSRDKKTIFATISAPTIIWNLPQAFIVEECVHDSASPLGRPDRFCRYTGPISPLASAGEESDIKVVGVVAVEGADDLRLVSLASTTMEKQLRMEGRRIYVDIITAIIGPGHGRKGSSLCTYAASYRSDLPVADRADKSP